MKPEADKSHWKRIFQSMGFRFEGNKIIQDKNLVEAAKRKKQKELMIEEKIRDTGL